MNHDHDEWRDAIHDLTEWDRAAYEEPDVYSDTMDLDGARL